MAHCYSVIKSCPSFWDPINCSMPGLPILHYLPEFAQIHIHWVNDAIQPFHPLSPPSPSALNASQHQSLFQCQLFTSAGPGIGASASASILPMNIQGWVLLGLTGLISLKSTGLSRIFSRTTIWKPHFFGTQPSLWSNFHICIWLLKKSIALTIRAFVGNVMSLLCNMMSRFVIAFLPRNKSFLKFMSVVTILSDFGNK